MEKISRADKWTKVCSHMHSPFFFLYHKNKHTHTHIHYLPWRKSSTAAGLPRWRKHSIFPFLLCILTDILLMDLYSKKVRCSANSMGSRWSNSSDALPFFTCFFRWVSLRIQSYEGLKRQTCFHCFMFIHSESLQNALHFFHFSQPFSVITFSNKITILTQHNI